MPGASLFAPARGPARRRSPWPPSLGADLDGAGRSPGASAHLRLRDLLIVPKKGRRATKRNGTKRGNNRT